MDFLKECANLGYPLSEKQIKKFEQYFSFLVEKNNVMNLTAITEKEEVYLKHFLDSIQLVLLGDLSNKSILDVGSGAGFPSIPLKIVCPTLQVTIIDALQKRITFLSQLVELLELEDVRLIHGRAEEFKELEQFDIVTSRAVARLQVLAELTVPFVKKGGVMVAMKSLHHTEELKLSESAISFLGAKLEKTIPYHLNEETILSLLVFKKVKPTPPGYPRNFGLIKKKPL
ncbi:MAG: 16S rRNA (guanine(527)-N(7))-methyltransferase RsmG [Candidatus Izemoplasmatales bacterium]